VWTPWLMPCPINFFCSKARCDTIYYTGFIDPGTGRHISSDLWCLLSLAETIMGPFVFVAATSLNSLAGTSRRDDAPVEGWHSAIFQDCGVMSMLGCFHPITPDSL